MTHYLSEDNTFRSLEDEANKKAVKAGTLLDLPSKDPSQKFFEDVLTEQANKPLKSMQHSEELAKLEDKQIIDDDVNVRIGIKPLNSSESEEYEENKRRKFDEASAFEWKQLIKGLFFSPAAERRALAFIKLIEEHEDFDINEFEILYHKKTIIGNIYIILNNIFESESSKTKMMGALRLAFKEGELVLPNSRKSHIKRKQMFKFQKNIKTKRKM